MKHIKTYEELKTVNFSELDNLIDKIKNKLGDELDYELCKYLTPEFIKLGNNEIKAYLLNSEFGTSFNLEFQDRPYRTIANVYVVFKENDKWKRSSYMKIEKRTNAYLSHILNITNSDKFKNISDFAEKYVSDLKIKYKKREEKLFKKDINKYNL